VVTGTEVRRDEVIVLDGNLIIEAGGNLTLINVTLYMNCSYDGEWQIMVKSGGVFNVLNGSTIRAHDPYYRFLFYVNGSLIMRDSELHGCRTGIFIRSDEGVVIENSVISHNGGSIVIWNSSDISIYRLWLWHNDYGIAIWSSSGISISRCDISDNLSFGIFIGGSTIASTSGCDMSSNGCSVGIWPSSNISISGCFVSDNFWSGIYILWSSNISISGCDISVNWHDGIHIEYASSGVSISRCRIIGNGYDGIYAGWSSDISVSGCYIGDNWYNGICIEDSRDIAMSGCRVEINGHNGIYAWGVSSGISISGCGIRGNGYNGIRIRSSRDATISGCDISNNGYNGIRIEDSRNIAISECVVGHNGYNGIRIWRSPNTSVSECNVSGNGYNGIYVVSSSGVSIHYCNITSNIRHGLCTRGEYVVNATYNWWGGPDGPEYRAAGDPYDPEEVYSHDGPEYLIYEPWLGGPVIEILSPRSGATIEGDTVTIEWSVEPGAFDVVRVEVRLDDGPWIDVTGTTSYTFTGLSEGEHVATIRAVDEAGNVVEESVEFYVKLPEVAPPLGASVPSEMLAGVATGVIASVATAIVIKKRREPTVPAPPHTACAPPSAPAGT